ncbi:MAG: START-like domain-containing protein [Prevotella sp.]|nr:START-like domain-containing protein [Bacteroides sp.]MCM1366302.1 START-like domain-containing protein [Prevotella sp.]MCM1437106.1 START-like domain-containing protein [Prevotella sp.]
MAKEKFTVQYILKSIPESLLWSFISDDAGLSSWFADRVSHVGMRHEFEWDGSVEVAELIDYQEPEYVKFHREDSNPEEYWELRISVDELTDETVLTVTDFSEPGEREDDIELWNAQIEQLKDKLGCR